MPRPIPQLLRVGGGLMTIDWVVLAAAAIGLAISAYASVDFDDLQRGAASGADDPSALRVEIAAADLTVAPDTARPR